MDRFSGPPPPYVEDERDRPAPAAGPSQFRIARKPVSTPSVHRDSSSGRHGYGHQEKGHQDLWARENEKFHPDVAPALPPRPRPELSLDTYVPSSITGSELYLSPEQTRIGRRSPSPASGTSATGGYFSTEGSIASTAPSSQSTSPSAYAQKAYREARHFAGGLISHPYEHTKHYTVLRHSHGLVF